MEKGRGQEYGYRGGSGGQGCLVTAFGEGVVLGHDNNFPSDTASMMVIADTSGKWGEVSPKAPVHYGGIAKKIWRTVDAVAEDKESALEEVPYFWVANKADSGEPVGISTFTTDDATAATNDLLTKMPSNISPSGDIGLFPCYTRGVNQYGKENVESDAISAVMQGKTSSSSRPPRIFGIFAHGELGPSRFAGFIDEAEGATIPCEKHSMTSILAIHTASGDDKALN